MNRPLPLEAIVLFAGPPPPPTAIDRALGGGEGSHTFHLFQLHPPFPWLDGYLADPSQPLVRAERSAIAQAVSGLLLHTNADAPSEARVRACARLTPALLDLGGIAVALPAAMKVVGRRQALTLGPQLQTPLGLSALFLHRHMVQNGPIIWYHCHGMEQFGLPDLESRGPLVEVETARQLVEQGVLYLLADGTALHPGLTLEAFDGGSARMIRVAQARAVSGHSYGAYGALDLTLTAR